MANKTLDPHAVLKGEQLTASDPHEHVWLSASAGTGKTYVLSARVLRLLLRGVKPDAILCITFTKAGAAEMAERVHERLAYWVRLDETALHKELEALGEPSGPKERDAARTLFAKVLESRGGGLRIMTIHAFCQTLLAGFPMESGLSPGFRPLEGREQSALVKTVLAELVVQAEREGNAVLLGDLRSLSLRMGEADAIAFLKRAAPALDVLEELGSGLAAKVRRAMDVPTDFTMDMVVGKCRDDAFDLASLVELTDMLTAWGTARAKQRLNVIADWRADTLDARASGLHRLRRVWCKDDGALFASTGWIPNDPGYEALVQRLDAWCGELTGLIERAALADDSTAALRAARDYARAYADAKRTRGLVDFDDLIRNARALLSEPGMGDWIRYKLDQATDHILVDEAQDTNSDQWAIVKALAAEYWAGDGAKGDTLRTIFTVGDDKQAIFGFQGTDPLHYKRAGLQFELEALRSEQIVQKLSLNQSFRSSPPVLEVVDALLDGLGAELLGIDRAGERHSSAKGGTGQVLLFDPVTAGSDSDSERDVEGVDEGEENWLPSATRKLAGMLARQVKTWLDDGYWLASKNRCLTPGDVMILVRKRGDLAALLVARLHEEGVPVAGVDRLRLQAPLPVQDLLAALRFAAQPLDDLNLAALLVSPLIGLTQDELFAVAHGRTGALWDAIPAGRARDVLRDILSAADNITPYALLETVLSGPLGGRKKILERLGDEARDPINELLNAALQFEREGTASLQQFLNWFDSDDGEIVRDAGAAGNTVRVLTVHGAKGLQAPLVILADACGDPEKALERNFKWKLDDLAEALPLFRPRSAERDLVASLQASMTDADDKARREHWRLLYVAMTRAEEHLVVAGSLGPRARGVVPEQSWHSAIGRALIEIDAERTEHPVWQGMLRHGVGATAPQSPKVLQPSATIDGVLARPDWLDRSAPEEARPPRPLAPSSIGRDDVANAPPSAAMVAAAERGRLLHALFERLPALPDEERRAAGVRWVANAGGDPGLVDMALSVIEDARYAALFVPDALAEAPVAGVVDGIVIAGTVDRLIITDRTVEIVDFKTGWRVPTDVSDIPVPHLRQMAAYAAVLAGIFPDHDVRASLLFSEGPVLHRLPPELLAAHKPSFASQQDNLVTAG